MELGKGFYSWWAGLPPIAPNFSVEGVRAEERRRGFYLQCLLFVLFSPFEITLLSCKDFLDLLSLSRGYVRSSWSFIM